jgi:hypothetical protein
MLEEYRTRPYLLHIMLLLEHVVGTDVMINECIDFIWNVP